jgi:hypothetical protein
MPPGWLKCSSANLMSSGIFQLTVSSLEGGVVPIMLDKMAQSSVVCQSVCLDLQWIETLWCVAVFTLLMPWMDACVWVLDNLKLCAHLSVMKLDWDPLSNRALHGKHWPDLFCTSTIAVASRMWFLGLPLYVQYVLPSAVVEPYVSAGRFLFDVEPLLYTFWFSLSICRKVW